MRPTLMLHLVLLLALMGCAVGPRWPDPEQASGAAAGTPGAIRFTTEGEPTDLGRWGEETLSLETAVREALAHSAEVQGALARVHLAAAEAQQARLLPNPIVSVVLRWPEGGGTPALEAGLAAQLVSLLSLPGRITAADHRLRAAGAEAVAAVLDVLAETRTRYVRTQAADALAPILDDRRTLLDRLVEVARRRVDAGEGTQLDVTTLEAQRVELEVEWTEQRIERAEARLSLARLIGRPRDPLAWSAQPWSAPTASCRDEDAWIEAALEHRPELQALTWELQALGVEVKWTGWSWLEEGDAGVESERDEGKWSVGPSISVPLPIFDWGQARRRSARARVLQTVHALTAQRRVVVEQVRQAYSAFVQLSELHRQMAYRFIPLLERRLREAESAFSGGQTDITGLILAEQDLRAGRARLIELERRLTEALIRLEGAVGGPGHVPLALEEQP